MTFFFNLISNVKLTAESEKIIIKSMTKLVPNFLEAYIKFWCVAFTVLKQYSVKQRKEVNVTGVKVYVKNLSSQTLFYFVLYYSNIDIKISIF